MTAWSCLMIGAVMAFSLNHALVGLVVLILAVMLPVLKRKKAPKPLEGWPDAKPSGAAQPGEGGSR